MSWTCLLSNETGEPLNLALHVVRWGYWRVQALPKDTIDPDQSAAFECDSFLDKFAGMVTYVGLRGGVTIAWDVPMWGTPTYSVTPTGAFGTRLMGSGTESGGIMYAVTAPSPAPRLVSAAPKPAAPAPATIVVPPSGKGRTYTNNPNEVPAVKTTPSPEEVVRLLKDNWPELGEAGARTLASQWAYETRLGANMYNYSLGNIKAGPNEPHMFLHNNTECWTEAYGDQQIARWVPAGSKTPVVAKGDGEVQNRCKPPLVAFITQPPHPASRFHAYSNYADGAARYITHHKNYADKIPAYKKALYEGDTDAVAHILRQHGYYNGSEDKYKIGMKAYRKTIDAKLGAVVPPSISSGQAGQTP
ncbi:MAG: hypothetical protein ABTD50_01670 [Polyangiaceae bacterium]|jgi:hypothetical protein